MDFIEPSVHLIGETRIIPENLQAYMAEVGAPEWDSNAPSDSEKLMEFYGRLCYRAYAPGLNKNVTKIREDNKEYLQNIVNVRHGSVLEHVTVNFVFHNVSRVFTHELVRHRVGVAISQESLRYVRLEELSFWFPEIFRQHEKEAELITLVQGTVEYLENIQIDLAKILGLDKLSMDMKKKFTSAMRRLAPIGLATAIGWSANLRTLRFVLEQRTSRFAEEEIRLVFNKIADIVIKRYPNVMGDYEREMVDGFYEYTTPNIKV